MFFGPASSTTTGTSKKDITIKYKIRTSTNEELRQSFFSKYIPRILSLGLTIPDPTLHFDEEQQLWVYQQPDWNKFKQIIRNNGPRSQARLNLRRVSYETNAWVRDALIPACEELAAKIMKNGSVAIRQAKYAITRGLNTDLQTGLEIEAKAYELTIPTEDRIEALNAFSEKRAPRFSGK